MRLRVNLTPRDVLVRACTAEANGCHRGYSTADDVASAEWPLHHEVPVFTCAA